MQIRIIAEGGNMKPNPALAQRMGPLGINMGKIISDVNNSTKEFAGMKVPILLDIDTKTKNVKVIVQQPATSELLKKEFGISKGSGQPHKYKTANVPIESLIKIALEKQALEKSLKSALKTVIGACKSLGIMIENKDPSIVTKEIDQGVYDSEINSKKTEASPEKLKKLASFFEGVRKTQESLMKKEEEEKAKQEEEKAAKAGTSLASKK